MNKGIHSRGYLPHWDFEKSHQAVTFRLADSVPASVVRAWRSELASQDNQDDGIHRRIAKYEDAGHGSSVLRQPECADIVQNELMRGHTRLYKLVAWVIMPNHVHVLCRLEPGASLAGIVKSWKGRSALFINKHLNRRGSLWQREYFDRCIRNLDHYYESMAYIHANPVKAGLCASPQDWPHSSAGVKWDPERRL